jgi:formylglycine-generating enzyme required for sulfatase activity
MGGNGTANFGFITWSNGVSFTSIRLGAYPTTNPWGLVDIAGGTSEWTEEILRLPASNSMYRYIDGSPWGSYPGYGVLDAAYSAGAEMPEIRDYLYGLRLASSVPSPSTLGIMAIPGLLLARRRRRVPS